MGHQKMMAPSFLPSFVDGVWLRPLDVAVPRTATWTCPKMAALRNEQNLLMAPCTWFPCTWWFQATHAELFRNSLLHVAVPRTAT